LLCAQRSGSRTFLASLVMKPDAQATSLLAVFCLANILRLPIHTHPLDISRRGLRPRKYLSICGLDARMLLYAHANISCRLITDTTISLAERDATALTECRAGECAGVPVARLVGEAEFCACHFTCQNDTWLPTVQIVS